MPSLLEELSRLSGDAFAACGLDRALGEVRRSDRPDLCEYQINGALAAAKAEKKNPRDVAARVAEALKAAPVFDKIEIAGPGFINLTLKAEPLEVRLDALRGDARLGVDPARPPLSVMVDFGGPNVAKTMHVGHLRSSILGDALQKLFRFLGHRVVSDIHMGDWGLQMGQLIAEVKREKPDLPYFDPALKGPYPDASPVTMDDLEVLYPRASAACKADPARMEEARQATAELQDGRPGYVALWKHFIKVTEVGLKREFGALGVAFDEWKGESDAHPFIASMVANLKKAGLAVESEGALVVPVAEETDKKEIPPLILIKSDGAVLYGTTDLATIVDRVKTHDPDLVLYVVDQRQNGHFEQVFRAARKSGIAGKAALEHVGFGTINGPDGKPFKTREGGVMKLHELIAMAESEAAARLDEHEIGKDYPPEERREIARKVGLAALKYADLSNFRLTNYVLDLARFTRFEGKTGPYLQYAAVRVKSLLRRAEGEGAALGPVQVTAPAERALALEILSLPEVLATAAEKRAPNVICDHVFALAQAFSRFYTEHHILSEADAALRGSRLSLAALTLKAIECELGLLGIEIPDRM